MAQAESRQERSARRRRVRLIDAHRKGVAVLTGEPRPERICRCGALMQRSWWQEVLENEEYQVVRADDLNPVTTVITIAVPSKSDAGQPFFLTVADVDWPRLLTELSDPVMTRCGEDAALLVHDMLIGRLHELFDDVLQSPIVSDPVPCSYGPRLGTR